jgi:hypothetical protein
MLVGTAETVPFPFISVPVPSQLSVHRVRKGGWVLALPADAGSFDFVRLAPHCAQDDRALRERLTMAEPLEFHESFTWRRRREFVITETELKLMAAAARIGLSRIPKKG